MGKVGDFLAGEVRKPVCAFGNMLRWIVKQTALCTLRLVLWSLFFMGPSLLLGFFTFHWFTGKVRNEIQNASPPPVRAVRSSFPPQQSPSGFSIIHSLSQDLRFWALEFEHLRR